MPPALPLFRRSFPQQIGSVTASCHLGSVSMRADLDPAPFLTGRAVSSSGPFEPAMAIYLDNTQRQNLGRLSTSWTWRAEWPTWLLIATIYGTWFSVATHIRTLGLPVATALLALLGTWYMSLQHELLHGHPTRSRLINGLLGFAPLAVWFPYGVYRDLHLKHHDDPHLTRPEFDPESYFVTHRTWQRTGTLMRALLAARNTFSGRLLVGPAFSIAATATDALRKVAAGDWRDVPTWAAHLVALTALTWWLDHSCGLPAWIFIVGVGYSALAIGSVRSFHEHRATESHEHRSVINEAGLFWRILFLNNNYHLVHHDLPHVPWFALREVYETSRQQYVERSGGFLVKGYSEWLRLYAFAPVASPIYGDLSDLIQSNPPASDGFAGKLRVKFMIVVRRGELHEADLPATAERQTAGQAL
jgi:fatty acid desaturase